MGIINTSNTLCCNPKYLKEEHKINLPDYNTIIDEQTKIQNIILIQSFYRAFRIRKLYKMTPMEKKNLCQEIPFSYSTQKYDNNEKILKLRSLLPKFELTEKEKFEIESNSYKKIALLYFDNSIYKGYVNNKNLRYGYGVLYYPSSTIYEGFFKNNKFEGRGRLYCIDGYLYDADFHENFFFGFGKLISLDGVFYRGNWQNDKQNGYGEETYIDGSIYMGFYYNGKKRGKGKFIWKNGNYYEGEFYEDEITGKGTYHWKDGKIYYGNWNKHKMEGTGIFIWPDYKMYIGNYKDDVKSGFGVFFSNNNKKYEGFWKEGKQHGNGIVTNSLQKKIYMEYFEGKKIRTIIDEDEIKDIDIDINKQKTIINFDKYLDYSNELIKQIKKECNKDNVSGISNGINTINSENFLVGIK